jgi:hypothetical protein
MGALGARTADHVHGQAPGRNGKSYVHMTEQAGAMAESFGKTGDAVIRTLARSVSIRAPTVSCRL